MWQSFWARAGQALKDAGVSEANVSERSFRHRNAFNASRSADSPPGLELIEGICRVCDIDAHYLVTGFGKPKPFIPPEFADETMTLELAAKSARKRGMTERAIRYVEAVIKPDPRLGEDRLSHLYDRAESHLTGLDEKRKARRRRKSSKDAASPGPRPARTPKSR